MSFALAPAALYRLYLSATAGEAMHQRRLAQTPLARPPAGLCSAIAALVAGRAASAHKLDTGAKSLAGQAMLANLLPEAMKTGEKMEEKPTRLAYKFHPEQ